MLWQPSPCSPALPSNGQAPERFVFCLNTLPRNLFRKTTQLVILPWGLGSPEGWLMWQKLRSYQMQESMCSSLGRYSQANWYSIPLLCNSCSLWPSAPWASFVWMERSVSFLHLQRNPTHIDSEVSTRFCHTAALPDIPSLLPLLGDLHCGLYAGWPATHRLGTAGLGSPLHMDSKNKENPLEAA